MISTSICENMTTLFGGDPIEVIIMVNKKVTKAGIFDDYAVLEKTVKPINDEQGNVLVSLNHILAPGEASATPDAETMVEAEGYPDGDSQGEEMVQDDAVELNVLYNMEDIAGKQLLKNDDFSRYRFFFVDIDPVRKGVEDSHIMATDGECKEAKELAKSIGVWLKNELGFPKPIVAFSGNGYHLLYRVSIPNVEENVQVFKVALRTLANKFNTDGAEVDKTVYNPVRLTKLYGSMARKGDETAERPYRRSGLLFVPNKDGDGAESLLTLEQIKKLAEMNKSQPNKPSSQSSGGNEDKVKKIITSIISASDTFIGSNDSQPYLTFTHGQYKNQTFAIDETLSNLLLRELHKQADDYYSSGELRPYMDSLKALAENKPSKPVYMRICGNNENIFYDLCADDEVVSIPANGKIEIAKISKYAVCCISLKRTSIQKKQVKPNLNTNKNIIDLLSPYLNITDDLKKLLIITTISWFVPVTPKVIIMFSGGQGTGKTFISRIIQDIVDPVNHKPMDLPNEKTDIVVTARTGYLVTFDNITRISQNISDLFCKFSTGGSLPGRRLYTDNNAVLTNLNNCLILNSIEDTIGQEDLSDRMVVFKLNKLPLYKTEDTIRKNFLKDLPDILGAIFQILQKAMKIYPTIPENSNFRMADYTRWGRAISKVMFGDEKVFLNIYAKNKNYANQLRIDESPLAYCLIKHLSSMIFYSPYKISSTDLRKKILDVAKTIGYEAYDIPKNPSVFSRELYRLAPLFNSVGFSIESKKIGGLRKIIITKINPPAARKPITKNDSDDTGTTSTKVA